LYDEFTGLFGGRAASRVVQREFVADLQGGDEERGPCLSGRRGCLDRGAQREPVRLALVVHPGELGPQVAETVGARGPAIEHQPFQRCLAAAGGVEPPGVAVEQERQQDLQRLGLARAVLAAQQQPPVAEGELVVVLPHLVDSGAGEPEPAGVAGQRDHDVVTSGA
jgi:hypothetical protein